MKFEVHIALGADGMSNGRAVAGALRRIAAEIENCPFPCPAVHRVRDRNGNRRGYWAISESESEVSK